MAKVEGIKKLQSELRNQRKIAGSYDRTSVVVGYTANYALYVHENVEMKWKGLPRGGGFSVSKDGKVVVPKRVMDTGTISTTGKGFYWDPQGRAQAKFLEAPFRQLGPELKVMIRKAVAGGATLLQALYMAGLRLQRESQLLVPVDTGNLKGSAFTQKEPSGPPK